MPRPISDEAMNALTDALLHGRKIEAIKIYREFTGLGLKESKDEIEAIEAGLREKFPDKFPAASKGKGCSGIAVVFVVVVAVAVYWFLQR
jgi:Ribosomal protein L7/L12 C-terminal domain